jgi:tetratricopeptide (TPR) repeat protein
VLAAAGAAGSVPAFAEAERRALAGAARAFGAEVCFLADGSVLAAIPSEGTATDRAARAARTALALRPLTAGMPLCVLVGAHAAEAHVTESIDRVVPLLRRDTSLAIRLDETAAGLLDADFDVGADALGPFLRGERDPATAARTLLGRPTPCVGRDREIAALVSLLAEAAGEGVARAALVTGEAGVGKSRLRQEVLRRALAERPDIEVWIGRSDPLAAGSPFALLGQALRRAAGVGSIDAPDAARRKLLARVGRHVGAAAAQGIAEFLGEVCGLPFDDAASPPLRAARREPALMADQVRSAVDALIRAECAAHPLVIALEDLHWGDLPSVRLLDWALRHEQPLFVLALARPEVRSRFPDLFRMRPLTEIGLAALPRKSASRLAREVLGEGADPALVERIAALSAGNAFYLEELIRAAARGAAGALPETVLAMAQSILDQLDAPSRRALRACSVFGAAFRPEGLAALLDTGPAEARALLEPLVRSELITPRDAAIGAGGEEYAFRHALLREAAYAMLDDADRALGHRVAARFLAASGEHDPMVLAEHFERGGQPDFAAGFYLRAAEQALAGNDLADAIARAERGVSCGANGAELGQLRLVQAEAERWRGRSAEGRAHALAALRLLDPGGAAWCRAASELASCALKLLLPETVDDLGDRLLGCVAASRGEPGDALVIACARVAAAALLGGRSKTARALLDVLPSAAAGGSAAPEVVARVAETRAIAALIDGDMCAFLAGSEAASAAFAEIGDVRSATIQRANQGHVYGALGAYEQAEAALRQVLADAEPLALPQLLSAAQQNLGHVLSLAGRPAEARALLDASLAAAQAQEDRRLEAGARVYLALSALSAGAPEEAIARVSDLTLSRATPALRVYALGTRSRAHLAAGRPAEALADAEQAMAGLAEAGGAMEEGETLVRLAHAEALLASGRPAEARAALAAARTEIEARAARITGDALRASFLSRVPENARALALSAALAAEAPRPC